MRSDIPVRQSGMFKSFLYIFPDPKMARPQKEIVRLCFADFFTMFQVPFRFGGPWDARADEKAEQVIVLGKEMNDRLFGGADSVGRTLRIENRDFRVVGVLDEWKPSIKFYDLTTNYMQAPEQIYMPFSLVVAMQPPIAGNEDAWKNQEAPGFAGKLVSESIWIQFWVELPTADHLARTRRSSTATRWSRRSSAASRARSTTGCSR